MKTAFERLSESGTLTTDEWCQIIHLHWRAILNNLRKFTLDSLKSTLNRLRLDTDEEVCTIPTFQGVFGVTQFEELLEKAHVKIYKLWMVERRTGDWHVITIHCGHGIFGFVRIIDISVGEATNIATIIRETGAKPEEILKTITDTLKAWQDKAEENARILSNLQRELSEETLLLITELLRNSRTKIE